jgi:hypothetical protein
MQVTSLKDRILRVVTTNPGLTDREITNRLFGDAAGQQAVNRAARELAKGARIGRQPRVDGKFGNFLNSGQVASIKKKEVLILTA